MQEHRWRGRPLIAPARTLTGSATQVALGLIDTINGPQRAIKVGTDGEFAIVPRQAMVELISNARTMLAQNVPEDRP